MGINSHQPLEGQFAWYEAHLVSEEGWNMLGGTFPGGCVIFHGVNPNLGWAHTVNQPDLSDIYELTMNPKTKNQYRFDGKWLDLEVRTLKLKVKVGPIRIPVRRTYYYSKHGPVVKNKSGYYAIRFVAGLDVKPVEQWYRMNKATNFDEFKKALEIQGLPSMNIVYADKQDNIFFMSNGKFSVDRKNEFDYSEPLPGDTSLTLWSTTYYPIDSLPQVLNPSCGYVFNTNNTPYNSTCDAENVDCITANPKMGYSQYNNNRSIMFKKLIEGYDRVSYEDFKTIKFNRTINTPAYTSQIQNLEDLFKLSAEDYPELKVLINNLHSWDRNVDADSKGAGEIGRAHV